MELEEEIQTEIDRRFTLGDRRWSFQGVGERHGGGDMFAPGKQLNRVAGHAPMLFNAIAVMTDHALVITEAGAILGEQRLQPTPGHRPAPAQVVAPVTAAVAGQRLILVATNGRLPAQAHALRTEQDVLATLAGHQAAEAERLAPQLERLQVAERGGVFAITGVG